MLSCIFYKEIKFKLQRTETSPSPTFVLSFPDSSVGKESTCNAEDLSLIPGSGRSTGEVIAYPLQCSWAFLVAQLVKNPPAVWETWVRSLDWEDSLEKGKATHSSILAWRIPWTLYSKGSQSVGHNWETFTRVPCSLYKQKHLLFYFFFFLSIVALRCLLVSAAQQSESVLKVTQSWGSTVHGILQARILEWVAFPFSRGSSQSRDQTQVSHIARGFFTSWATREATNTSTFFQGLSLD